MRRRRKECEEEGRKREGRGKGDAGELRKEERRKGEDEGKRNVRKRGERCQRAEKEGK